MSVLVNKIRKGYYLDSVALMRLSREIAGTAGIDNAALMIGSETNKNLMRDAGLLNSDGESAKANDLIVAVRAVDEATALAAVDDALAGLDTRTTSASGSGAKRKPRSLSGALDLLPDANLALISVPGEFAVVEARAALAKGLHVMMFSDNVSVEDERSLKVEARERGLLVMGPDCGTCIIGGIPIAFANEIPGGPIGLVAASGTGLQEVTSLIARAGKGITHGIGVGGRDLKDDVGGIMTLAAINALDDDEATKHIVLISKPPSAAVTTAVLERVARSAKPFTICFLGAGAMDAPDNARVVGTLKGAAESAIGSPIGDTNFDVADAARKAARGQRRAGTKVRGLFSGGTLCSEAQIVFMEAGCPVASNVPVPGADRADEVFIDGHVLVDLGADEYTVGRPHPMIDTALRTEYINKVLADPTAAVLLLDVVIGYGAHADPATEIAAIVSAAGDTHPAVIASVCGTEGDPQVFSRQAATLRAAGIIVAPSNADAAAVAVAVAKHAAGAA